MRLKESSVVEAELVFDEIKGLCEMAIEDAGICVRWGSNDLSYYIRQLERELLNLRKIAEGGCLEWRGTGKI